MEKSENTKTTCRICLENNNKELKWVFEKCYSAEKPLQFSEMLKAFATVKIYIGDGLPEQICSNCAQDIIKTYLFKIKCEESEKTLRNRLEEDCRAVLMSITKLEQHEENLLRKSIQPEIEDDNNCIEISDSDDASSDGCVQQEGFYLPETIVVEENYTEEHNQSSKNSLLSTILKKEGCARDDDVLRLNKIAELSRQIKMVEEKLDSAQYMNNEDETTEVESPVCADDSNLQEISEEQRHPAIINEFSATSSVPWECEVFCDNNQELQVIERPYKCQLCGSKFAALSRLQRHTRRYHNGEKRHECDVCKRKFAVRASLKLHRRIHDKVKYKCDMCKMEFNTEKTMIDHKERVHNPGEKQYECDVCKKRFVQPGFVEKHKRIFHSKIVYKCDFCPKKFDQLEELNIHKEKMHRNVECELCGMKFFRRRLLISHKLIIHSEDRPFECDVCKKKFTLLHVLNAHKRIHTGEKPFECDVCKMKFAYSGSLTSHRRTHKHKRQN